LWYIIIATEASLTTMMMMMMMMVTMIVDKELNSYMLNVQQNSLIIRVKGIKF
jgi:hypothetical protein